MSLHSTFSSFYFFVFIFFFIFLFSYLTTVLFLLSLFLSFFIFVCSSFLLHFLSSPPLPSSFPLSSNILYTHFSKYVHFLTCLCCLFFVYFSSREMLKVSLRLSDLGTRKVCLCIRLIVGVCVPLQIQGTVILIFFVLY